MNQPNFQQPQPWPRLAAGKVHLWLVDLDQATASPQELINTLSSDENQRRQRFHDPQTGARYAMLHLQLRRLLGHYSDLPAAELQFERGEHGKPRLQHPPLHFNSSRAGRLGLLAFSAGNALGIDIEQHRADSEQHDSLPRAITAEFFSRQEREALASLPEADQNQAFYQLWTRKEAYLKALGCGLSRPLQSFSVCDRHQPLRPQITDSSQAQASDHWQLRDINITTGFSAALVSAATDTVICRFRL